jgi:hypothetical protein
MNMLKEIQAKYDVVMLTRFGSHLYGTDTETSDTDYKGIYMPTKTQILLGKFPKSVNFDSNPGHEKNKEGDIDCELYSFHYFLELCAKGEMVALDMLHANTANIAITSALWRVVQDKRAMFYTTDMKAFVGYAKKQAAKYGMKGSRLESSDKLKKYLETFDADTRMFTVWAELPLDENMFHKAQPDGGVSLRCMEFMFCGKTIQSTAKVGYVLDMVRAFEKQYGHRAKAAQANEGVDWKAMSHALRAAYQISEIFETGDLKFPLEEARFLKKIKQGCFSFKIVLAALESMLTQVDEQSKISLFPATVKRDDVDFFIKHTVANHLGVKL